MPKIYNRGRNQNQLGQSLFEVIFALGLSSVILMAIVALSTTSIRDSTFSKDSAVSTKLTSEVTEWLRSERDRDWSTFVARASSTGRTWCLPTNEWPSSSGPCGSQTSIYTRSVVLTSLDNNPSPSGDGIIDTVDATVTVSWQDAQGIHDITNQARYTDWQK